MRIKEGIRYGQWQLMFVCLLIFMLYFSLCFAVPAGKAILIGDIYINRQNSTARSRYFLFYDVHYSIGASSGLVLKDYERKAENICEILPIDAGCIIAQKYCLTFCCTFQYILSPLPQLSPSPPISIPISISLIVSIFPAIFISRYIVANENYSKRESAANKSPCFAY
jgi:hypothetical protein